MKRCSRVQSRERVLRPLHLFASRDVCVIVNVSFSRLVACLAMELHRLGDISVPHTVFLVHEIHVLVLPHDVLRHDLEEYLREHDLQEDAPVAAAWRHDLEAHVSEHDLRENTPSHAMRRHDLEQDVREHDF